MSRHATKVINNIQGVCLLDKKLFFFNHHFQRGAGKNVYGQDVSSALENWDAGIRFPLSS